MFREGKIEAQKKNDKEVHAGAGGPHHHSMRMADESRSLLIDEVDAADEARQPRRRPQDPHQFPRTGAAIEGLQHIGQPESERAGGYGNWRRPADQFQHDRTTRRRNAIVRRTAAPNSRSQNPGSAPEPYPTARFETPSGSGDG